MVTISLCMIVKNEEKTLARCLDSVKGLVEEINIIDTGSTDKTKEIAQSYTERVFEYPWTDSFADARNESMKYASCDYIFFLDADEVLLEKDQAAFQTLKETLDPSVDAVSFYNDMGYDPYGNVTMRFRRIRLIKRERNFKWAGDCHNYLMITGKTIQCDIAVTHKKIKHSVGRTISIYEKKIARGDAFTARDYFYYGNECRENKLYQKAIESYNKNISIEKGWVEDKIFACIFKGDCYRFLGDNKNELLSLFESFRFAPPRAEACCRIGYNFQHCGNYKTAAYWYELAANQDPEPSRSSFIYLSNYTWYPHLQLCVCYYYLRDYQKSWDHNTIAESYRPEDKNVLHNKKLLEKLLCKNETTGEASEKTLTPQDNTV